MIPAPPSRASRDPQWGGGLSGLSKATVAAGPLSRLEKPQLSHTGVLDLRLQQGGQSQGHSLSLLLPLAQLAGPQ